MKKILFSTILLAFFTVVRAQDNKAISADTQAEIKFEVTEHDIENAQENINSVGVAAAQAQYKDQMGGQNGSYYKAGNINGVCRVSSSTVEQPTSSPARIANSTNPAPGNTTAPDTA